MPAILLSELLRLCSPPPTITAASPDRLLMELGCVASMYRDTWSTVQHFVAVSSCQPHAAGSHAHCQPRHLSALKQPMLWLPQLTRVYGCRSALDSMKGVSCQSPAARALANSGVALRASSLLRHRMRCSSPWSTLSSWLASAQTLADCWAPVAVLGQLSSAELCARVQRPSPAHKRRRRYAACDDAEVSVPLGDPATREKAVH